MNIILSAYGFFPNAQGGGEVYVYRLAKELLRKGHDVTVLTTVNWTTGEELFIMDEYSFEEIPVITFTINPEKVTALEKHTGIGPITNQALQKIILKIKPDIVHINGIKPALTLLCNNMNIRHVITAHHAGIVCPSGTLLHSDDSICSLVANTHDCVPCCNYARRPKWYTGGFLGRIPASIYRPLGEKLNLAKNISYIGRGLIYSWLVENSLEAKNIVLDKAGLIIAPSLWIKELLIHNGCDSAKISVVSHGIEPLGRIPFERHEGSLVKFGYIGRINPPKGLHCILQAMQILKNEAPCELHIYGKTLHPWEDAYLKELLGKYKGNSKIMMHGNLPHQILGEAFQCIDVLIVPSIVPEAFGLVVNEAFSAGRPVIVFDSGALPELVRNEIDGFVVERNNGRALAEVMRKIILRPQMIMELSSRAPLVKTIQVYADEMSEIYNGLIGKTKTLQ